MLRRFYQTAVIATPVAVGGAVAVAQVPTPGNTCI